MKTKTKKYPPSKVKYLKNNPSITFNLPLEISQKIDEMCQTKGITKSQFLKRYFMDQVTAFEDLNTKHAAELENIQKDAHENGYQKGAIDKEKILKEEYEKNIETTIKSRLKARLLIIEDKAYDEGYNNGRKEQEEIIRKKNIFTTRCYVCKKPVTIDISNDNDKKVIIKCMSKQTRHTNCID